MKKSKALVLFDIDGTLMRGAGPHHKQALIDGISKVTGLATHLDGVATSGMLDRDLIAAVLRAVGWRQRAIHKVLREIIQECQRSYCANCPADLSTALCPGVRQVVQQLKAQDAMLGLVTGNLSAIGWKKIELAGLSEYFSIGAFAEDGTTRTRLAKLAAQRARRSGTLARDAKISLLGDHENDVLAAKANGFQSIAVATGFTSFDELARLEPDIVVRDFTELDTLRLL